MPVAWGHSPPPPGCDYEPCRLACQKANKGKGAPTPVEAAADLLEPPWSWRVQETLHILLFGAGGRFFQKVRRSRD